MSKRILDRPYRVLIDMSRVKPSATAKIEILRGTESLYTYKIKGGYRTSVRLGRSSDGGGVEVSGPGGLVRKTEPVGK